MEKAQLVVERMKNELLEMYNTPKFRQCMYNHPNPEIRSCSDDFMGMIHIKSTKENKK